MKTLNLIVGGNAVLLAGAFSLGIHDAMLTAVSEGFQHIVPDGLDHVAFLLGLVFLTRNFQSLLWQVTLFTLAHSVTFGLAMFGMVHIPSTMVEVAVALSIAFVAAENVLGGKLEKWRPLLILFFGLIHGLAFAHTLQTMPSNPGEWLPRLFGFNIGIELGQLAVVGLATTLVRVWWKRDWYHARIAVPASMLIGLAGLAWTVERLFAGGRPG